MVARKNLYLGTAAVKDAGVAAGNLMAVGAFGGPTGDYRFFGTSNAETTKDWNTLLPGYFNMAYRKGLA
ncbi:hypothetical protein [Budvicia aquatica]|uniref:hypothetical protein n=1 Tax=Budvicia aquatica TaxID=82979 RepID=UPI00106B9099|nr:hypothetical protein [Budvicia aquatica]